MAKVTSPEARAFLKAVVKAGHSAGGLTTRSHRLADALGHPLRLIVTAASAAMSRRPSLCVMYLPAAPSSPIRPMTPTPCGRAMGAEAATRHIVPQDHHRHEAELCGDRNGIERCFNRLKPFPPLCHTLRAANHSRPRLRSPRSRDYIDHPIFDPPWTVRETIPSTLPAHGHPIGVEISQVLDQAGKRRCLPALCRPASRFGAARTAISHPRSPCAMRPAARRALRCVSRGLASPGTGGAGQKLRRAILSCPGLPVSGCTRPNT